ncbi:MAG: ATP-binding cassette domain-containing protein, partial [Erysipelotrichaceae bacterium]|nr:ATP-binding cassette domain-containing protein [Erysipelotrichaceae bacterium]
ASSADQRPGRIAGVSFEIYQGECLAMAGRTYSGLREMISILARTRNYKGTITLADSRPLSSCRFPYEAGLAPIDPRLLKPDYSLSLLDSLLAVSGQQSLYAVVDTAAITGRFEELVRQLGLEDWHLDVSKSKADLSARERVQFAIVRALFAGSRCLLLDRVFQGLEPAEIKQTAELLRKVKQLGVAIVLVIDEYFPQVETLADRIITFRHGKVSYVFYPQSPEGLFNRRQVELAVSGRREERMGTVLPPLSDQKLTLKVSRQEGDLVFSSGQRIGIYDPSLRIPSDWNQLAQHLSSRCKLELNGQPITVKSQKDFLSHKAVIIGNDYLRELFLNLSPVSNVVMVSGRKYSPLLVNERIDRYIYREVCQKYEYLSQCLPLIERKNCYGITELLLRQLAVAKWLSLDPDIALFFDLEDTYQPAEQHHSGELYRQLAREGRIVITVSANLDFLEKTSELIIS